MDDRRQVIGGVLPDQEDAGGNFSQTDSAGGPGDRPLNRPDRDDMARGAGIVETGSAETDETSVAGTAGGGYGVNSGSGSSGGSAGGGDNASAGPATDFVRGATGGSGEQTTPTSDEPRDTNGGTDPSSLPPDVTGE